MIGIALLAMALGPAAESPKPKWPIGKETTYVTGPIDKDGYVDYPAALNDRLAKGVTPQNNANVLIWKALGPHPEGGTAGMPPEYFTRLGIDPPPERGDYFIGWARFRKERLRLDAEDLDAIHDERLRATKQPWAAKDHPQLAAWLAANEKPLAVIIEATKRPAYFNPLIPTRTNDEPGMLIGALLPAAQKCREVTAALAARAMLRVNDARYDEAWQDLLACHRLARLVGTGATNIEALIGIALNATACNADVALFIANARLTSQQIRDRIKDLERLPPMPAIADKMELGERFVCLDALQGIHRDMYLQVAGRAGKPAGSEAVRALNTIDFAPTLRKANKLYDRMTLVMRLPDREARAKELKKIDNELDEEARKVQSNGTKLGQVLRALDVFRNPEDTGKMAGKSIGDVALGLMMPAVMKVQNAYDRCDQVQRNVVVAFALAAYRADTGRYPAKLNDLAPKYIAAVPGDMFSGKPLVYRPIENGYLLYSVGPNCNDDGGRSADDEPAGDDLVVRMPLPELKLKK